MRLDPRDFNYVRPDTVKIDNVRSREQIARLKEVNVRVDIARQNEFAFAIDLAGMWRQNFRANCRDSIAIDHDRAVRVRLPNLNSGARTNQRAAGERDFFGVRCKGEDRQCDGGETI